VMNLQMLFQSGRIKISVDPRPESEYNDRVAEFKKQLQAFRPRATKLGETYEGVGAHDDMVLSAAIALWYAETIDPVARAFGEEMPEPEGEYNPLEYGLR